MCSKIFLCILLYVKMFVDTAVECQTICNLYIIPFYIITILTVSVSVDPA